jgi:predicted secreted hydrolase
VEQSGENRYTLFAAEDGVRLELILEDTKGPILQGNQGYSRKGPEEGNASIYFSQTRLEASGTIEIDGRRSLVRGSSWMDHEFSTSALSTGQIGWDWFSIQLEDGSELMVYTIRRADGSVDDFSQGTVIQPDGKTRRLTRDDFNLKVDETWVSPHSGGKYPSGWSLEIPSEGLILSIRPLLADQELNLSFIYWEGAVEITGQRSGVGISGHGYVELTGYAQSLEGRF